MIIFKCKEKIFDDTKWKSKWKKHGNYYYGAVRDDWRLVCNSLEETERYCSELEFDDDCYLLVNNPASHDLQKDEVKGEPFILADGNEWTIKTIADVRYKFTLKKEQNEYKQQLEVCDPLFTKLINYSDKMKDGIDYEELIDLIADVLACNYYVNKNIVLAMQLLDTYNIDKIVKLIYRYEDLRKVDTEFFRTGNNEHEVEPVSDGLSNSPECESVHVEM